MQSEIIQEIVFHTFAHIILVKSCQNLENKHFEALPNEHFFELHEN